MYTSQLLSYIIEDILEQPQSQNIRYLSSGGQEEHKPWSAQQQFACTCGKPA